MFSKSGSVNFKADENRVSMAGESGIKEIQAQTLACDRQWRSFSRISPDQLPPQTFTNPSSSSRIAIVSTDTPKRQVLQNSFH